MKIPKPYGKQKTCEECMYYQGLIKALVSPCPHCSAFMHKMNRRPPLAENGILGTNMIKRGGAKK